MPSMTLTFVNATTGASVSYYMEAQDDEGQPVASRGTEERPLVISFAATGRSLSPAGSGAWLV